jgi:hypothetical protein
MKTFLELSNATYFTGTEPNDEIGLRFLSWQSGQASSQDVWGPFSLPLYSSRWLPLCQPSVVACLLCRVASTWANTVRSNYTGTSPRNIVNSSRYKVLNLVVIHSLYSHLLKYLQWVKTSAEHWRVRDKSKKAPASWGAHTEAGTVRGQHNLRP